MQMEASGVPKPLPCTASMPILRVAQACQEVLCSKADAFLEVCTRCCCCSVAAATMLTSKLCHQAGKRQIRERGTTILFKPAADPLATAQCYVTAG